MLCRRIFLRDSALAMFGVGVAPAWLAKAASDEVRRARKKVLVTVFQRGAADGLNIVVPFGDSRYYELRPTIAIPRPHGLSGSAEASSDNESAIDLDGFFGLHPSLSPLKPLYDAGHLAIVHAAGSPDPTRSHFDAQDYMESGTPGRKITADGWLNRAIGQDPGHGSPVQAVALGTSLPRSLRGVNPAIAINNLSDFQIRNPVASDVFEAMYAGTPDRLLQGVAKETFDAVKLLQSIEQQPYRPAGGAGYPRDRFGGSLQQIARLIKADVGLEVAFTDIGGWDHHVNEVGQKPSQGTLATLLAGFGRALAAFWVDLGDRAEDVVLVTMSEFGRAARENGNRGTDHGHANVMFVMGGGVCGGKVYGQWPGLAAEQLYEGRDLNLTTDFRDVLLEVASRHLGCRNLPSVFPGYAVKAAGFPRLLGA